MRLLTPSLRAGGRADGDGGVARGRARARTGAGAPEPERKLNLCAQAGALTGTEAWHTGKRAGERARALEQAFLNLNLNLNLNLCAQAGALTGTEAWRAGERARALEQAFLELDRQMAAPENRAELAELAGAQDDEDPQCAPSPPLSACA